jgi:hypothetical protein
VRLLPGMVASDGPALPFDRDARRRGLALQVGVALPVPARDGPDAGLAGHLVAHGADSVWLGLDGEIAAERTLAAAKQLRERLDDVPVLCAAPAGVAGVPTWAAVVVLPGGAPVADTGPEPAAGLVYAGGAAAAERAASMGASWLIVDVQPQDVLRLARPEQDLGVVVCSSLRREDRPPARIGATGPIALRVLLERYVAVGVSTFVLEPAADDLERWAHDVLAEVADLSTEGRAPCGC